jgi:peroxiredoxin
MRNLLKANEKVQIYAITIDPSDKNKGVIQKIEADGKGKVNFNFLTDLKSQTIEMYGLRDERYAGKQIDGIPRPAIFILDKKRKVQWVQIEEDYKKRPSNSDIRIELDKISAIKK